MPKARGKPLLGQLSGKWYSSSFDQTDLPEIDPSETSDGRDEEEDVEIKISASGSVLTPSSDPYDKLQKLKIANAELLAADLTPRPPAKVRFNDSVTTAADDDEGGTGDVISQEPLKTSSGNILLVTVPTGFSDDAVVSDEDVVDETENDNELSKNTEDSDHTRLQLKNAITFSNYSVDMKSVDDDYENTVEDITTTLVSLCRMTSECEDTDLESNISKYAKVTFDSINENVVEEEEDETEEENDENGSFEDSQGGVEQTEDDTKEADNPADEIPQNKEEDEPVTEKRIKSARMASRGSKNERSVIEADRPSTSPGKRVCFKNQWAHAKLPSYNGLRSEYGLSAEQLDERKKKRVESAKRQKQHKEELFKEEKRRQKENEQMFANWLVKKKKEAAMKAARRKQLQSAFYFKTLPAPTNHLEKLGVLRKKVLARREHTCYSLEEFFKNAKPHEQKTYKIYLGLSVE